jgi:hypothetical protein
MLVKVKDGIGRTAKPLNNPKWSIDTHMLQIPKAGLQIPEQDPQEMGSNYFSLENHINLVQASQTPDKTIQMH